MEPLVIQGLYKHYNNGNIYRILHESINKDTNAIDIVYREKGKRQVYNQSKKNFFGILMIEGKKVPRFKYLEDKVK